MTRAHSVPAGRRTQHNFIGMSASSRPSLELTDILERLKSNDHHSVSTPCFLRHQWTRVVHGTKCSGRRILFSRKLCPDRSHRLIQEEGSRRIAIKNPTSPRLMVPTSICPRRFIDTHTLELVEFDENDTIPSYAILSHRWIEGEETVSTEFLQPKRKTRSKSGYWKIKAACRQARSDNIRYIWVDTCCIKTMNHDDVTANVASMYAFYQNAEICYAYLCDVRSTGYLTSSEWFKRGWTLQELLAPRTVIFFNQDWQCIGDKHTLRDDIHRETTIPPIILSGELPISDVDVLTRMSWAARRKTTRLQDKAYCLQGLLGVLVEPDYDETFLVSLSRLGEALFSAWPQLNERPGIKDNLFRSHRWMLKDSEKETSIINPTSPAVMAPIHICPHRFIDTCTLELVEFSQDVMIPQYAILSHRWLLDEEIVYDEYIQPQPETFFKAGYQKIRAACRQARHDGIHYIWVDTCCIKQGNHADVKTNITSMYAYYQNAEVCYTYLADVKRKSDMFGSQQLEDGSDWFRRGWTLQELLAPRTVIFFNQNWQRIGDKHDLQNDIHRITTIPAAVLSGEQSIQDIDVLTRMSWAMGRVTTRRQDQAYCLQGLLGVAVEPDYAERWKTSFNRLAKALFGARPDLRERSGIKDDLFSDPDNNSFYVLLRSRFTDALDISQSTMVYL